MIQRTCKVCGKYFETDSNRRLCCSFECSEQNRLEVARGRGRMGYHSSKTKKRTKQLVNIAIEARKEGLSYGKYVALHNL